MKIKEFLKKIKEDKHNIVLEVNDNALSEARRVEDKIKKGKAGKLAGLGFLVKANINVAGYTISCGSKTLADYKGSYNATVIDRLLDEDAVFLGIVNMDEFAAGSSGESSTFGVCKNPRAPDRIPGGSSSGSAASVAAGLCDFSLGSDTGGSIRNPASHCGVLGFKPSYGSVSRYGLIDLSMSLDVIGVLSEDVKIVERVYSVIKGRDKNDASSLDYNGKKKIGKVKIGIVVTDADKVIWDIVKERVFQVCNENNWDFKDVKLEYVDLGIQTYYPINYVEFYSGTRKFDGRKYGKKIEEVSGTEVIRRIAGGKLISQAEFDGRYYWKALQAKKLIEREFEKAFEKYDVLILPSVPRLPHKIGEKISIEDMYNYDALTVLANLAEVPAISVPAGAVGEIPVGLQLISARGEDDFLLKVAERF